MSIGVAVIGAGAIGALRAAAVAQTPGLRLAAVADLRHDLAQNVAARHGGTATDDWQEAIARPDVGIVVVCTPPNLHARMALAAIERGKHVLCEKPLAHTLDDAEQMCAAAEARGLLLATGFNHRYFPSMAFAKRLITDGVLGRVIRVQAYAGHPGGKEFGHPWVHDGCVTGGGSMVDNGIHILDLTRFFMGDVETAAGVTANLVWPFETAEDNGFALFRSPAGAVASVHASWTEWRGYQFAVEVVGTRGFVKASYPPMLAIWGTTPKPGIRARRRYEVFPGFQIRERLRGWEWTIVQSFVQELRDFTAGVRSGRSASASGRDGLRAMQLAHAVYRASRAGSEVAV